MNVNYDEEHARKKARNVARSCDGCRRRKIRCDGPSMKGNRCSSCLAYGAECTYVEPAKACFSFSSRPVSQPFPQKRGPPKGYIESMQTRIEKIERLLQTLLPDADLGQFLSESSVPGWKPQGADEDERAHLSLCENLQRLSFSPTQDTRFFGRSSGAMLLQTALNVKKDAQPENSRRHTEFWASRPSPGRIPPAQYTFPPPDLAESLIDLYFDNVNLLLPLLHRPTFDRQVAAGVPLENGGFAATYLLVCAIGSRYSSDPRVLLDGTDNSHSCGWRWFEQLQLTRDPLGPPVSIYDLQTVALAVLFIQGSSAPQASWTLISFGIRIGQDVGAHRRKDADQEWTAEDELWKRAFWVLVYLDRICSSYHGRPSAIHDEDFDLDFPVDCDDEYWEAADPDGRFQQPRDKPSKLSAFIALLRLCQVLSFALRTIYSLNKSKVLLGLAKGTDSDWEQRIVDELNTALDNWIDGLPNHLRWNPEEQRPGFFDQAVALHCSYYNVKMTILRTYIPSPKHMKSFAVSPLALCLNAAKTCLHIVDVHRKRTGNKPLPLVQGAIFVAGLVLALNLWAERPGPLELSTDSSQEIAEIQTCMHALQDCETRWHPAGRLWDILSDLIKGIPLQGKLKATKQTRTRHGKAQNCIPPGNVGRFSVRHHHRRCKIWRSNAGSCPPAAYS
ncbi:Fungal-trans domain-containing protein [Mycena kentingensis (nom. inval.)]|nr:Fungal-trans domain-containing protein [Mycena kentingensis (nom. inval.)]